MKPLAISMVAAVLAAAPLRAQVRSARPLERALEALRSGEAKPLSK